MSAVPPPQRYSRPAVVLHWLIFLLVALAYFAIEFRGPRGAPERAFWTGIHLWAGVLVLLLSIVRIGWRATHAAPAPVPGPALQTCLARAAHVALYVFILAQPILGILLLNLNGRPVTLIGLDWSFAVVGPNPGLRPAVKEAHELLGNAFYFVIGLHALAALWHHYIKRDDTLKRMI